MHSVRDHRQKVLDGRHAPDGELFGVNPLWIVDASTPIKDGELTLSVSVTVFRANTATSASYCSAWLPMELKQCCSSRQTVEKLLSIAAAGTTGETSKPVCLPCAKVW